MAQTNADFELQRYLELSPKSRALWEEGKAYLPGADTRSSVYWDPYPLFLARGEGSHLWDADGVERIDFINNMTSLILGHAHPAIVQALQQQATRGTAFAGPNESQIRLAQILCQRIPSLELVRFTNSGTEATLNCLRAARAYTGRSKIAKVEGGYHGTHDAVSVSVRVPPGEGGDARRPAKVPSFPGLSQRVVDDVVLLPFNDTEASREILEEHGRDLAAVIVEPVLGGSGMIPAEPDYLAMLRGATQQQGALLIFDEVISLRVAPGGAQEHYGITPDMTAMGKIIGGGLPVGAFGGRSDIMELYDPTRGPRVPHAGTFQGNPMTMEAGIATMERLTPEVYARLAALTDRLSQGISSVCAEFEVPVQVTGLASLYGIHFTDHPVRTYRDVATSDKAMRQRVFLGLMNEGIFIAPQLIGAPSTPMGDEEVDAHVEALRKVLGR